MQNDEVIWQVINHQHCSFKHKTADDSNSSKAQNFCRNEFNVTGLCNRSSCPLANSRYATIKEHDGRAYLYTKTIERAHTPKRLWERMKLSQNYERALSQVTEALEFFPKHLQHRNKQRLTRVFQILARMRKLQLMVRPKLVGVHKKVEVRENRRETKALKAAKLGDAIKGELLSRLKSKSYGDMYESALEAAEQEFAGAAEELEDDIDAAAEAELEDDDGGGFEFVEADDDDDEEDLEEEEEEEIEDSWSRFSGPGRAGDDLEEESQRPKKRKAGPAAVVEIEYDDDEPETLQAF